MPRGAVSLRVVHRKASRCERRSVDLKVAVSGIREPEPTRIE